ncbi:OLC1v1013909C1 [Oldenlandia corymbosa var. corymbosa]|uniref:OLC1v1013909C1 n=1 Tax=Oldenlandia corymbosa var. corymbosa TaxID=529605 RepID=A0AAV1E308_OLDCO|nr:OLC1v1013909C1 [Oldenlandia corymbosa var. corymbosa]
MNEKAGVSKELNAKHAKILDGLLKHPENRECADCRSKAPRWASINLGIFICMQCSGIHRSLGVHISKVRSTTLDTWLPEQVAFMQSMGNQKANSYWEGGLPLNVDRSNIESFIRAKYQEKRWISPKATLAIHTVSEKCSNGNNLVGGARNGVPRKARKYSLEEEMFSKYMLQAGIPARPRTASLDITDTASPSINGFTNEHNSSVNNVDNQKDVFSLLYVPDLKHDRVVVPPSHWATFECKTATSIRDNAYVGRTTLSISYQVSHLSRHRVSNTKNHNRGSWFGFNLGHLVAVPSFAVGELYSLFFFTRLQVQ